MSSKRLIYNRCTPRSFHWGGELTVLIYFFDQNPSREANRFSASRETPRILWNPRVHYRVYKSPPPLPILNQINSVHAPTSHFLQIQLNILPSTSGSSKWFLSVRFLHQNLACTSPLLHTSYMACRSHSSWFDRPYNFYEYISLRFSLRSLLHSPVTLSLLGPSILLTPNSRTLSLLSSLSVSDQVSHPHKITGKIIVHNIFLDSKLEDKRFCTEW